MRYAIRIMTLPLRRALAFLFAALFLVIAPLSVAYGRGYRFDTKTRHIRLTGVILLAGSPSRVRLTIDDDTLKDVSFPTTLRGLLPTTHTILVEAMGYTSQVFTFNVRSGQTTFATDLQLYRINPFTTLRTGIPKQALLAPDGTTVAWLEGKRLTIAGATSLKSFDTAPGAESLVWTENSEDLLLRNASLGTVAVMSRTGTLRDATYVLPAGDRRTIDQLLNSRMTYSDVQTIPGGGGWLLTDESSAWILQTNGDLTLATRWGNTIVNAIHLGRQSLVTVRREEVLVRNVQNAQTALYEVPGITQATAGTHEGEINLLVADGNLLQWKRGNFF